MWTCPVWNGFPLYEELLTHFKGPCPCLSSGQHRDCEATPYSHVSLCSTKSGVGRACTMETRCLTSLWKTGMKGRGRASQDGGACQVCSIPVRCQLPPLLLTINVTDRCFMPMSDYNRAWWKDLRLWLLSVDSVSNWKFIFSIYLTWSHRSYYCILGQFRTHSLHQFWK